MSRPAAKTRKAKDLQHVVMQNNGRTALCLRCERSFTMSLPCPLSIWVAAMKEFCKLHAKCEGAKSA